jgi:adenosylcobinamide hydrolase
MHTTRPEGGRWDHHLLVDLGRPCLALSNAVWGGGLQQVRYVVNRSVPKGWSCAEPAADMQAYLRALDLEPKACIGLITAVSMAELRGAVASADGWQAHTLATVGVSNAAKAGGRFPLEAAMAHTINLVVIVEGVLTPAALVGAVKTATEAKTAALFDARIKTRFGERATGTSTDTVTVISRAEQPASPYAGPATAPGYLIGKTVYEAVRTALKGEGG